MNAPAIVLAAFLSLFALSIAHAAQPAGTIGELSGIVMAVKADGRHRILATTSRVEVGDMLVTEADSYVRLVLDNGNEAVLGPVTTLKVARFSAQESALALVGGQLQVSGGMQQGPGHRFTLEAGGTTVAAGASSFIAAYVALPADLALTQRQVYLRSSLAALASGGVTDGGADLPLRDALHEVMAQVAPAPPRPAVLPPGLHVHVLDGLINLTNKGGSMNFSAGQFGYTPSFSMPPVTVPANPGLKFTPPPVFQVAPTPAKGTGGHKADAVDCEVR